MHVTALETLWNLNWPDKPFEAVGNPWRDLGFQTNDPSTDFRGGGILSLEQMIYFAKAFPELYQKMINCEYMMFWAISAINISNMLYCYFDFLQDSKPPPDFSIADSETIDTMKRLLSMN